jgi:DNA (cytosine-5)-methyltransferase 1
MKKPQVISLFSGAGGLDFGFEAAGFETGVCVEFDETCASTLRSNRPWRVIPKAIEDVPSAMLMDVAKLKRGQAAMLIGGPPCQPFSKSGFWATGDTKRLADSRANTLGQYLRVLEDTLPDAFLLENVEGLAYEGKDEGLQYLLKSIDGINRRTKSKYQPYFKTLNAVEYGVPQARKRLFVVASRTGTSFEFPLPTHGPGSNQQRIATAWDAIGDVVNDGNEDLGLTGRWADLLPSIPEGHNYLWHTDRMGGLPLFGWRTRYWSFLLKLAKALPSWTIQAQPGPAIGPFHWDSRRLSMRELCRIQTFPDNVHVFGSRHQIQKQIGNAVPSLLAEVIAREIRRQFFADSRSEAVQLRVNASLQTPPATVPRSVPEKFHVHKGKHQAHPGTGKGPISKRREQVAI